MISKDWIGYERLVDRAQRSVVREALRHVASGAPMGNHHFYITYDTQADGVVMSDVLRSRYPEQITIVLQNQFWDLKVFENHFEVTLTFNKMPETLSVPFTAMRQFVDPSRKFGLQFGPPPDEQAEGRRPARPAPPPPEPPPAVTPPPATTATSGGDEPPEPDKPPAGPTVVSLDKFRKK